MSDHTPKISKKLLALLENPKVRSLPLDGMNAATYNPRGITAEADAGLETSILTFGIADLICVNERTNPPTIVGGHRRYDVLRRAGAKKTKVVVLDLSPSEEMAANLALNSRHLQGHFTSALGGVLDKLKMEMPDLSASLRFGDLSADLSSVLAKLPQYGVGFGGEGIDGGGEKKKETPPDDPGAQIDRAAELQAAWKTRSGQLWSAESSAAQ